MLSSLQLIAQIPKDDQKFIYNKDEFMTTEFYKHLTLIARMKKHRLLTASDVMLCVHLFYLDFKITRRKCILWIVYTLLEMSHEKILQGTAQESLKDMARYFDEYLKDEKDIKTVRLINVSVTPVYLSIAYSWCIVVNKAQKVAYRKNL